jgi:hypothetical protein
LIEEHDGLGAGFEEAQRFGFETEVQDATGALAQGGDVIHAAPEVVPHGALLVPGLDEFLEGTGDGADAAFDPFGEERREQVKKEVGELETVGRGPVGRIDLFLDARAMELAVRESVQGEDVAIVLVEPALEGQQGGGGAEFPGGLGAEAQADGIRLRGGADAVPDGQGELVQCGEGFGPGLPAMDVGAVGEVEVRVELQISGGLNLGDWLMNWMGF